MVKTVTSNSAAGLPHPDDPNLLIQQVSVASATGIPTSGGAHAFGYTNGLLTTDTWTVNGTVYVKSYIYTNGILTGESDWVKQ